MFNANPVLTYNPAFVPNQTVSTWLRPNSVLHAAVLQGERAVRFLIRIGAANAVDGDTLRHRFSGARSSCVSVRGPQFAAAVPAILLLIEGFVKTRTLANILVCSGALLFPYAASAQQSSDLAPASEQASTEVARNQQSNAPSGAQQVEDATQRTLERFRIGAQGGVGIDPVLIMIGAHSTFAPIFSERVEFRPGIEFGFGEVTTLFGINLDVLYVHSKTVRESRWTPYVGGRELRPLQPRLRNKCRGRRRWQPVRLQRIRLRGRLQRPRGPPEPERRLRRSQRHRLQPDGHQVPRGLQVLAGLRPSEASARNHRHVIPRGTASIEIAHGEGFRAEGMALDPARVVRENPEAIHLAEVDEDFSLAVAVEVAQNQIV